MNRTLLRTAAALMLYAIGTGSRIEGASPPQDREKDWAAVGSLPRGTHIKLTQRSGLSIEGRLEDWSDDALTVRTPTGNVKAPRATVVRVVRVSGSDRTRRAGWGFLAGAVAGAAQGGALVLSNRGAWITVLAAGWGAIGAAIGAASGGHRESVIYESPGSGGGAVGVMPHVRTTAAVTQHEPTAYMTTITKHTTATK